MLLKEERLLADHEPGTTHGDRGVTSQAPALCQFWEVRWVLCGRVGDGKVSTHRAQPAEVTARVPGWGSLVQIVKVQDQTHKAEIWVSDSSRHPRGTSSDPSPHPAPAAGSENTNVTKRHVGPPGRHVKAHDPPAGAGGGGSIGQQTHPSQAGLRAPHPRSAAHSALMAREGEHSSSCPGSERGLLPGLLGQGATTSLRGSSVLSGPHPCTLQPEGFLQDS